MATTVKSGQLAIDGGTPVRNKPFPKWPIHDERDEQALLGVLRSGQWGSHMEKGRVTEFREKFAAMHDAKYGIAVTNGTAALEVALRAVGVEPLDEVLIPPYTFVATATAVLALGAIPVFCDIREDTMLIDAEDAAKKVTPRTKAIVAVHIAGQPADMDAVLGLAKKHNLKVVEDAAQAHWASWRGTKVGALGDAGSFSFQSSKNVNSGEGGIVVTNDREVAGRAWSTANVGRVPSGEWYQHELMGWNLRLTEFQAALLLVGLERLPEQYERRERNARYLDEKLGEVPGIIPQARDERVTGHAHHLYLMRYDKTQFGGREREWFLKAMHAEGVPISAGYTTPLYRMNAVINERNKWAELAKAAGRGVAAPASPEEEACPVAERICGAEGAWMGQTVLLGEEGDMAEIVEAAAKIQSAASRG
jgi:dTDP-4-amino-4,6-dideoxygalactose transaminase